MPVISMRQTFVGPDGKTVVRDDNKSLQLTLARAICESLWTVSPDEKTLDINESYARGKLGFELSKEPKEYALTSEQIVMIKSLITKRWLPVVAFQMVDMLEGEPRKTNP